MASPGLSHTLTAWTDRLGEDYSHRDMPHQVGVDIIEIARIGHAAQRWGDRFLHRIYTTGELAFARGRHPQLAARFAAKEAVMKALGTGRYGVSWREIEVVRQPGRAPRLVLSGRAKVRAEKMGLGVMSISISHSREYAVAVVVASDDESPQHAADAAPGAEG